MIDWKESKTPGLRHALITTPGYDCRAGRCTHKAKGGHGVHNEEWIYVVSNGEAAINLIVSSGIYPATVKHIEIQAPEGVCLGLHVPWAVIEDDIRSGSAGEPCAFIDRPCFSDIGFLRAEAVFNKYFSRSHDKNQPESFWIGLEREFKELLDQARATRPAAKRCLTCAGTGLLK